MHDMDRTRAEYGELAGEQYEGEGGFAGETVGEAFEAGLQEASLQESGYETGYESGYETGLETGYETYGETGYEFESLGEAEEVELASELLEITNEAELDRFLGKLVSKAVKGIGKVVKSPVGRALGGILKKAAKVALPLAGKAAGAFFGGPVGAAVGGQLASAAGRAFGLELEGLSAEDAEFEVARRYVRFASAASRRAANAPSTARPQAAARAAAVAAARRHAPGLVRTVASPAAAPAPLAASSTAAAPGGFGRRGTWYRRGRRIIIVGV
jgi:hypothetical protein